MKRNVVSKSVSTAQTQTSEVSQTSEVLNGFQETEIGLIPADWDVVPLGKVAKTASGGTPNRKRPEFFNGAIPWVKSGELGDSPLVRKVGETITELGLSQSSAKLFPPRTLLVAMYGATVGKVGILGIEAATNQAVCAIFPSERALPEFLFYALIHRRRGLLGARYGGAQPNISQTVLRAFRLAVPPLPEQRRIARVLNAIQRAIVAQDDLIAAACQLKRSLMHRLFTYGPGAEPAATKETEIGETPEHWDVVKLGDTSDLVQYGTSKRCDRDSNGIPVLRIPNVIDGRVGITDLKFAKLPAKTADRLRLEAGDILFVRTNGRRQYTGRCAVFEGELQDSLFASYLIRVRLAPNTFLPHFVQGYTETNKGKAYLSGRASRAADGKFNINSQTIKSVLVPRPSLSEQEEIVSVMQTCDAKIAAEQDRKTALQAIFESTLRQLMTGCLRLKDVEL